MSDLGGGGGGGLGGAIAEAFVKIKPDFSTFGKDAEKGVEEGMGKVGKSVQTGSRVALGAITAIGGGLVALGTSLDDAYDNIRANTTATGTDLEALNASFRNVAQQVPNDLGAVSDAVAAISTRLGLTGPALDKTASQMLQLAHVTGEDLGGALDATASVFNQFGIKGDAINGTLDQLFQASKASGTSVSDLATQVNKSGGALQGLGLSLSESIDFLALLDKNGVDANKAVNGLAKTIKDAAANGVPAREALEGIFSAIKNAPNDTDAAAQAIALFGQKAGPQLAQAIRGGTLSLDDLAGSLGRGSDTIEGVAAETADAAETFKKLKNQLSITLGPAANKLFDSFGKSAANAAPAIVLIVKALAPLLEAVSSLPAPVLAGIVGILAAGAAFGKIVGPIKQVIQVMNILKTAMLSNPWILLGVALVALVVVIVKNWDKIKAVVLAALEVIKQVVGAALTFIQNLWNTVWGAITTAVTATWDAIRLVVETAINAVQTVITTVTGAISAVFDAFLVSVTTVWGAIKAVIGGVVDFIIAIPSRVMGIFGGVAEAISGPFKTAFNLIAKAWNNTVGSLSFSIPDWVPLVGGKSFSAPKIPEFRADGGPIIPGRDYIVGERGPEVFRSRTSGDILPNDAMAAGPAGGGVVVQGPLLYVGNLTVRDDQDVTTMTRMLAEEANRKLKALGDR